MKQLKSMPAQFKTERVDADTIKVTVVTDGGATITRYGCDVAVLYDETKRDYDGKMMSEGQAE